MELQYTVNNQSNVQTFDVPFVIRSFLADNQTLANLIVYDDFGSVIALVASGGQRALNGVWRQLSVETDAVTQGIAFFTLFDTPQGPASTVPPLAPQSQPSNVPPPATANAWNDLFGRPSTTLNASKPTTEVSGTVTWTSYYGASTFVINASNQVDCTVFGGDGIVGIDGVVNAANTLSATFKPVLFTVGKECGIAANLDSAGAVGTETMVLLRASMQLVPNQAWSVHLDVWTQGNVTTSVIGSFGFVLADNIQLSLKTANGQVTASFIYAGLTHKAVISLAGGFNAPSCTVAGLHFNSVETAIVALSAGLTFP